MTHPPQTRALARVLWLWVISREGNFYKGLFSKQWYIIFYITKAVFERFWGKMVGNPSHFSLHENEINWFSKQVNKEETQTGK